MRSSLHCALCREPATGSDWVECACKIGMHGSCLEELAQASCPTLGCEGLQGGTAGVPYCSCQLTGLSLAQLERAYTQCGVSGEACGSCGKRKIDDPQLGVTPTPIPPWQNLDHLWVLEVMLGVRRR